MREGQVRYHQMLVSPHVGGGARVAMAIHGHLMRTRGPVSHLLIPPGGEAEQLARTHSARYTDYDLRRLTSSGRVGSFVENFRLWRRLAPFGDGVLHVHAPFVFGAIRALRAVSRLRTVLHVHLDFTAADLEWPLRAPPAAVVLCAEFMRDRVMEVFARSAAGRRTPLVRVIRNAVDTERYAFVDKRAAKVAIGADPDRPLAMIVANLSPHKGQETAIRAVGWLKSRGHDTNLWIVGAERQDAPGYRNRLEALCRDVGVGERVRLLGYRSDVVALMQAADFVLLPSTSEGMPLTLLEAQACGAIVVAAPTAGIPEVVEDGRTGFLVAAHDHLGYAERLAALETTEVLAASLRNAARRQVEQHGSIERYCAQIDDLYDEILPWPLATGPFRDRTA